MNYITIKEAAQKWKITQRAVQGYCKNCKIPGAKQIGKQWLIPIDAEKPGDGRTKAQKQSFDYTPYHFPIFVYSEFFSDRSALSEDELTLLEAQILTVSGEHFKSFEICKKIINSSCSSSVKLGAYATNAQNCILYGMLNEVSICVSAMEKIRDSSPAHSEDYNLIINFFLFMCSYNTKYLQSDIDIYKLSNDALIAFELIRLWASVFEQSLISPNTVCHYEALCREVETIGVIPAAMLLHGQIALLYSRVGENEKRLFHINKAARLGYENKYFTTLSRISILCHNEYMEIYKSLDIAFAEKANRIHQRSKKNLIANLKLHNSQSPAGKLGLVDASTWEFLLLLSDGLSNKKIALIKDISLTSVSETIKDLCNKLGYSTKEELVNFANSCFTPQPDDAKIPLNLLKRID